MPPKAKFTKEEIVSAALELVRKEGIDALTARSLGTALSASARPIFTVFDSMDEVREELTCAAKAVYGEYQKEGLKQMRAFKGSGMGYIRFAFDEPNLFRFLFMTEEKHIPDLESVLKVIDDYADLILQAIMSEYGVLEEVARKIYQHAWIYSHGIATLVATGVCKFTLEEISDMLDISCGSVIRTYMQGGKI